MSTKIAFLILLGTTFAAMPCNAAETVKIEEEKVTPEYIMVEKEPPTEIKEEVTVSPGASYVWDKGHWKWDGSWKWVKGHWLSKPHPEAVWVHGHWIKKNHHWVWVRGRWE